MFPVYAGRNPAAPRADCVIFTRTAAYGRLEGDAL